MSALQPRLPAVATKSAPARPLSQVLFVLIGVTLGVDWLFPLKGLLSYVLAALTALLAMPWAVLVFRFGERLEEQPPDPRRRASAREQFLWGLALRVALVLVVLAFLVAKFMVLQAAQGKDALFTDSSRSYSLGLSLLMAAGLAGRDLRIARLLGKASLHPARLMAASFGGVGLLGALLLSLPVSVNNMSSLSLVDNLFMAFSATCVTGLATVNIGETYSFVGQLILMLLIQIGGLGIMVLSAALAILSGQRLRVKSSAMLTEVVDGASLASLKRTVLMILVYTLLLEAVGAVFLHMQWTEHPPISQTTGHPMAGAGGVWWAAIFHSVSAFCNAGMSNVVGGLMPFSTFGGTLSVLGLLVFLGGLGFPVLDELSRTLLLKLRRRRAPGLSLHARVVLRSSAVLLVVMTLAYVVLEWRSAFEPLGYAERLLAAGFQSAVVRSGGFNIVDIGSMQPATLLLTSVAMFIGAGPGSTGGGIKVTTLVVLIAGLRAELRARSPQLLNRALPDAVIRKAIGVAFLSMCIVMVGFFFLLLLESHSALDLAFEAVSAFSTTGLSTGITSQLSLAGKLLVVLLMFVGRIGPLTLALAISVKSQERLVALPQERVLIG